MRTYISGFLRRGVTAMGIGPLVLAVLYLVLYHNGAIRILTVGEVCLGILSLSALAFIAGGMNVLYQMERLPLMLAILIHGSVLYLSYLATYLINGWLEWGTAPILTFTVIFVVGYLAIWAVIYSVIRRKTENLNAILKRKQQNADI